MKSKSNPFVPFISIIASAAFSPLNAANIDTTGVTTVLNIDNPANKYLGNGILQVSANGADVIVELGTSSAPANTEFALTSGGLITIDSGVTLRNGGWSKGVWTNNKADMQVNGSLDLWDGNPVRVNALNGAGPLGIYGFSSGTSQLVVGVDGGGGTYSGAIPTTNGSGRFVRILKEGTGTQIFNNLANQKAKEFYLNAGVVNLQAATDATLASNFSGVGNLTKTGAGVLTLSGTVTHTGVTTVSEGTLSIGTNLSGTANLVVATGAVLNLNFAGQITVSSLQVAGSGPLPAGLYNSSHGDYGSNFTGTGTLKILGPVPADSGIWTSLSNGNWTDFANWQGNTIASGVGNTATFNAATGVTVTLDANFTIGHLAFDVSNYTISGLNTLTLDAASPTVTVAGGKTAAISSIIAGTAGLTKLDAGLLTLSGANTYTGGTTVTGGRLQLVNNKTGSSTFMTNAELEFNLTSGDQTLSGGTLSGTGNLIKTGGSMMKLGTGGSGQTVALMGATSIIDVQGGTLRNDFGNSVWGGNKAGLSVASGATFDIWDGSATVDELNGSGSINKGWAGGGGLTIGVNHGSGTFSGTISNTNGTMSLVKQGTGTQILTGSNTYSGTTKISAGILSLGNSLAMQNSTLDTLNSIAGDATNGLRTTVTSLTLGGLTGNKDLASVFTTSSGGYHTVTALTLNLGTGLNSSYRGVIAEGAAGMTLTKTGLGALSLSGADTYTGATTVNAGVLGLRKSSTSSITVAANAGLGLVVGGAGNYTLADVDSLWTNSLAGVTLDPTSLMGIDTSDGDLSYSSAPVSTRGFAKLGLNTLTLTGNNALTFAGGATVYAGVLSFANTAAKPGTGTVTVLTGAGLALGVGGVGYYTTADVDSLWANTLGGVTLNATSLVGIDTTAGDVTYTTPITPLTRGFAKVGSNTLTLTGANAYTGGTTVGAGRLKLVDTATGSPNYTTNGELELQVTTGSQRLSKNGTLSGTGNLIKSGAGTLYLGYWDGPEYISLTGANSIIDVQEGWVINDWGNAGWAGNKAGLSVGTGTTFDIGNANVTVDELNGSGTLLKAAWDNTCILTIGVNGGSGSFSGAISQTANTLALVKQGSGTQTLSGTTNFTGGTTVTGGRLQLVNNKTGSANFITNAELEFNVTTGNQQLVGGTISGTGNLVKTGSGQMWLGGNGQPQTVALTGATSIIDVQGGMLRNEYLNSGWGTNKAGLTVASGAIFDIWDGNATVDELNGSGTIQKGIGGAHTLTIGANDGSGTFSGTIGNPIGTLALVKQGSGTQTLTGINTYSGATTVSAGTLALVGGHQTSGITVSAGASLGFTLGSPTTSTSSFDLSVGTVKITGMPTLPSYTLIASCSGITGTPTLNAPILGYALMVEGVSLKLVQTASYGTWADSNAPTGTSADDFDGDGVNNGTEYVIGGTKLTNDLGKLPKLSTSGGDMVFTFNRDQASINGSTSAVIEVGIDLDSWPNTYTVAADTAGSTVGVIITKDTSPGFDTVTLTVPRDPDAEKFARLKVTTN